MSSRALGGAARLLLGSVADEALRTAHVPVLLVRQRREPAAPASVRARHRSLFIV